MTTRSELLTNSIIKKEQPALLLNEWAKIIGNSFDLFHTPRLEISIKRFYFDNYKKAPDDKITIAYHHHLRGDIQGIFELFEKHCDKKEKFGWGILNSGEWVLIEIRILTLLGPPLNSADRVGHPFWSVAVRPIDVTGFFNKNFIEGSVYQYFLKRIGLLIESWQKRLNDRSKKVDVLFRKHEIETFLSQDLGN